MAILRNSAKCTACGKEIESKFRHNFVVHFCEVEPEPGYKWDGDNLVPTGKETYRFFLDGGKDYIRRGGKLDGFKDTSEYEDEIPQ